MPTAKQIAANKRNAQKSTGPRTEAGKATVSQNAWKHGFFGRFRVLEGEDQQQYNDILDELMLDQKPVGALETDLVRQMAQHLWLAQRACRYQEGCFIVLSRTPGQIAKDQAEMGVTNDLERFTYWQNHHNRLFHRSLNALLKLRKERENAEIGFERRKRAEAEENRRDKRQEQRDDMHQVRYATAQINLQIRQMKFLTLADNSGYQFAPPESPETTQMAA